MGTVTPNIGIFVPTAGETNYDNSFLAGMIFLDQHDHTGPPNGGKLIPSAGLGPNSVTRDKLNANVVSPTGGLSLNNVTNAIKFNAGAGVSIDGSNNVNVAGVLLPIFNLLANGLIARTSGTTAAARTITGTANQVSVTNGDAVAGNPVLGLPNDIRVSSISFDGGSNLLGNYATATWVPTLASSNADLTGTYSAQTGNYQRIGKWAMIQGIVNFNVTGGSGNFVINALPFSAVANCYLSGLVQIGALTRQYNYTYQISGSNLVVYNTDSTPNTLLQVAPSIGSTVNFQFTGVYLVA